MNYSTRFIYGIRLLIQLGLDESGSPVLLKTISNSENISIKYLSQIILSLKTIGIVCSFRGKLGGYILNRPLNKITVFEIYEALEGKAPYFSINNSECKFSEVIVNKMLNELNNEIKIFLSKKTLKDLVDEYNNNKGKYVINYNI